MSKSKRRLETIVADEVDIKKQVRTLLASGEFDDSPHALYNLTESIREFSGDYSITPGAVLRNAPKNKQKGLGVIGSLTSLENYIEIREFLSNSSQRNLVRYGRPEGNLLLARDMAARGKNIPYMALLGDLTHSKSDLEHFIGRKRASLTKNWNPRSIDLRLDDAETIIEFLKMGYKELPDEFFDRYGSKNGVLNLARDLKEIGLDLEVRKIHSLVGDPDVVSSLLGIKDPRFKLWKPKTMFLDVDGSDAIISHLRKRYEQNPERFFEVYGSNLGTVILAKEFQKLHKVSYNLQKMGLLISDGRSLESSLGVNDLRFRREWKPGNMQLSIGQIDSVLDFLKLKYEEDSDKCFSVYGGEMGALNLSRDLKESGIATITPNRLQTLTGKGKSLSMILGINDERFGRWYQGKIGRDLTLVDSVSYLLMRA